MTRKLSNIALAAVLMCGLSLVAASCSDSNKELSEEEKEQQAEQQADQTWPMLPRSGRWWASSPTT